MTSKTCPTTQHSSIALTLLLLHFVWVLKQSEMNVAA